MRPSTTSAVNRVSARGLLRACFAMSLGLCVALTTFACEGDGPAPAPPPPSAPNPAPTIDEGDDAAPAQVKEVQVDAQQIPLEGTTPTEQVAELPQKPPPTADKDTRRALLVAHYRTLRCLTLRGAPPEEFAEAFEEVGMNATLWNQALGELLQVMAREPEGEVARALSVSDSELCSGGGQR